MFCYSSLVAHPRTACSPAAALAMAAGLLSAAAPAFAQCHGRFLPTIPPDHGLSGAQVNAMTQWDPDASGPLQPLTIMVGEFNMPGVEAARNVITWTPRGSDGFWGTLGNGVESRVLDVTVFNGQPVIALAAAQPGQFSTVLRWTGSVWEPMSIISGPVHALRVYNGQLYAAGDFASASGQICNDLARWTGTTWESAGLGTSTGGKLLGMTTYNGELIVAGEFDRMGGMPANNIARFDGLSWRPLSQGVDDVVTSVGVYGGWLVAGGDFTSVQGGFLPADHIASWDGSTWSAMGLGVNGRVSALHSYGGRIYAGGEFTLAGGQPAPHVAAWNGSLWQWLGEGTNDAVTALGSIGSSELLVGGRFTAAGEVPAARVARYQPGEWSPLGAGANGHVQAFAVMNGALYAGGDFNAADGVSASAIAKWNGGAWQPVQNGVYHSAGIAPFVSALAVRPTGSVLNPYEVVAGGSFTHVGGPAGSFGSIPASNIASNNGQAFFSWDDLTSGVDGWFPAVYAETMHNGQLYVGGGFASAGGSEALGLARWNGSTWTPQSLPGFSTSMFDSVNALLSFGGQLIVGGSFEHLGFNNIAVLSGSTWSPLGIGMDGDVRALTVYKGQIIAGGRFDFAGVDFSHGLARWTGSEWKSVGLGFPAIDVNALAVYNEDLYVGGYDPATNLAMLLRWDGSVWWPIYWDYAPSTIDALTVYNGELIVGGRIDGDVFTSRNWLRYSDKGEPWFVENPAARAVGPMGETSFTAKPVYGYETFGELSYQWRRNGVPITDGPGGAGVDGGVVSGATGVLAVGESAVLTISEARPSDQGDYDCVISTPCGSGTSLAAPLTVVGFCAVDFNEDGLVDFADYLEFLSLYDGQDARADLNADGIVEFADYLEFLNHFDAGC